MADIANKDKKSWVEWQEGDDQVKPAPGPTVYPRLEPQRKVIRFPLVPPNAGRPEPNIIPLSVIKDARKNPPPDRSA